MDFSALDAEINRGSSYSNLYEAGRHIRSLKSMIIRLKEQISFQEKETARLGRAKHRAERNSKFVEGESLGLLNKKLLKEKTQLINRNVFLIKQNHALKNELCEAVDKCL